ncbi:MAG: glycosyltransferase family 2 protein, partial [Deltaproteobacteria bacterium]
MHASARPLQRPAPAVVVVTWRGGALVERCLQALRAQTLPPRRIV